MPQASSIKIYTGILIPVRVNSEIKLSMKTLFFFHLKLIMLIHKLRLLISTLILLISILTFHKERYILLPSDNIWKK